MASRTYAINASLRHNVLLEARRLVGAAMKNPALDRAPEYGPKSGPKIGCAHSGLSYSRCDGGCASSCLTTAVSKKVTLARFDQGAWTRLRIEQDAGTARKTTFVGPRFGVQILDPKTGATSQSFITTDPILGSKIWTPKWGPGGEVFLEPARFPKTVSASKSCSGASACLPVPVSFLFGRHADFCSQLRICTNCRERPCGS